MKFKEVIFVVLIMLIFAMVMLMYIVINDSIKASSVPIISNNIEDNRSIAFLKRVVYRKTRTIKQNKNFV